MEVVVQDAWYTVGMCESNPETLYVFGDNLVRYGMAGQAQIRNCDNSIGIPTKATPSMVQESFFSDKATEKFAIDMAIDNIVTTYVLGGFNRLVFPAEGLGTGLALMPSKSPKLYKYMNDRLREVFGGEF